MAIYVGIDPGVKTGIAVWDTKERKFLYLDTLTIIGAMIVVRRCQETHGEITIVVEDARQRKYLPQERSISEYRGKLMGAGSIKRDCEIWENFASFFNIPIQFVPPRKGLTKWDADYFKKITGWTGRTSNHARDAAILIFNK